MVKFCIQIPGELLVYVFRSLLYRINQLQNRASFKALWLTLKSFRWHCSLFFALVAWIPPRLTFGTRGAWAFRSIAYEIRLLICCVYPWHNFSIVYYLGGIKLRSPHLTAHWQPLSCPLRLSSYQHHIILWDVRMGACRLLGHQMICENWYLLAPGPSYEMLERVFAGSCVIPSSYMRCESWCLQAPGSSYEMWGAVLTGSLGPSYMRCAGWCLQAPGSSYEMCGLVLAGSRVILWDVRGDACRLPGHPSYEIWGLVLAGSQVILRDVRAGACRLPGHPMRCEGWCLQAPGVLIAVADC